MIRNSETSRPDHETIDGYTRPRAKEDYFNGLAARLFSTGGGQEFLVYLKSITLNHVAPGWTSNEELHYLEGARWIVGIIQKRVSLGQRQGAIYVSNQPPDPDVLP